MGYTAGSGIIITGIGKKAKNPYVKGVTQILGGTLIIIGQVAETGMNSYVWLHNTYSIPYNKKNWTYRGGAIVPNANR